MLYEVITGNIIDPAPGINRHTWKNTGGNQFLYGCRVFLKFKAKCIKPLFQPLHIGPMDHLMKPLLQTVFQRLFFRGVYHLLQKSHGHFRRIGIGIKPCHQTGQIRRALGELCGLFQIVGRSQVIV